MCLQSDTCSVLLEEEDREVSISCDHLEPMVPEAGDTVKVIVGDEREAVGQLLSIDEQEGLVKFDNEEVKMLQLKFLCKFRS